MAVNPFEHVIDQPHWALFENLGWKVVIGIYIWHAVYALHLGALYSPLPAEDQERVRVPVGAPAGAPAQRGLEPGP